MTYFKAQQFIGSKILQ